MTMAKAQLPPNHSIDDRYLFTLKDEVSNVGNTPVTLIRSR